MENAFAAIVRAIHNAASNWFKEQPVTPEKIAMALKKKKEQYLDNVILRVGKAWVQNFHFILWVYRENNLRRIIYGNLPLVDRGT